MRKALTDRENDVRREAVAALGAGSARSAVLASLEKIDDPRAKGAVAVARRRGVGD